MFDHAVDLYTSRETGQISREAIMGFVEKGDIPSVLQVLQALDSRTMELDVPVIFVKIAYEDMMRFEEKPWDPMEKETNQRFRKKMIPLLHELARVEKREPPELAKETKLKTMKFDCGGPVPVHGDSMARMVFRAVKDDEVAKTYIDAMEIDVRPPG